MAIMKKTKKKDKRCYIIIFIIFIFNLCSCDQKGTNESSNNDKYVRTWFCIGNSSEHENIDFVEIKVDGRKYTLADIETKKSKSSYIYHKKNSEVKFKITFSGDNGKTYTKTVKPSEQSRDWYSFGINENGEITSMR
jgi:hypothetical protein